jgi:hypothetical protein
MATAGRGGISRIESAPQVSRRAPQLWRPPPQPVAPDEIGLMSKIK